MPKVLYIGFGISPFIKGGAIVYQESLIEGINALGWETVCFFAGGRYDSHYTIRRKPYLKAWRRNKIKFIELCNSPNIPWSFTNPDQQCYQPDVEKLTQDVLDEEKPDLVHFHELQTHTASIIDIVSMQGIPSVKTMHNYYDICPQRDLMYTGSKLCIDFDNGKRCVDCLTILPVRTVSFRDRIAYSLLPAWLYKPLADFYKVIKIAGVYKNSQNKIQRNYKTNTYSPDRYFWRRQFFVEQLNKLNTIHCSSCRSAEIFINCGVVKEKIKIIPLSVKSIEKIYPKPLRDTQYPIVFGYVSGSHLSRGFQVLIDAFAMLDQAKSKLIIWGMPESGMLNQKLNIELRKPYQLEQINQIFQEIDVGIIPSTWEEIFGIIGTEWLTARIPVIGSNIGGIPEWLKDGENGFLVAPNNVQQLAQKMKLFIENPALIAKLQQQIKPWKSFNEHVKEMVTLYGSLLLKN